MTNLESKEFVGLDAERKTKWLQNVPWCMTGMAFLILIAYVILYFSLKIDELSGEVIFNIASGVASLGFLSILCLTFALDRTPMDENRGLFLLLILLIMAGVITDNMGWLLDGKPEYRMWNQIASFGSFIVYPLVSPVYWMYQDSLLSDSGMVTRSGKRLIMLSSCVVLCYLVGAALMGFLFSVDLDGTYHAHPGSFIALLYPILVAAMSVVYNLHHDMPLRKRAALISFSVLSIITTLLQMLSPNYSIGYVVASWVLLLLYGVVQMDQGIEIANQRKELAEKNRELMEQQMQIMVSQIQPHFMYNTLGTISALCTEEPELAQEATDTFAEYLRANLNAMGQRQPVSFDTELMHVKRYVWIEELRFQDYLRVEYDIQSRDFLIPALSVQPLVENAIKHGVCKKDDGGTVWISSIETAEDYRVIIRDDGVGFDPSAPQDPSRSHVGVQNVRSRLAAMVDGTLIIESEPGKGTTSTIVIPK